MEMSAATETRKKKRMQRSAAVVDDLLARGTARFDRAAQRPSGAFARLGLLLVALSGACADEGVGDPCTPEAIPAKMGMFGFEATESYVESSSVQCRSRLCIVNKLDNGTNGSIPADPRVVCNPTNPVPGCVAEQELKNSVFCTCKCGGPKTSEQCECPDPFICKEILTLGGEGIKGSYCVRK
jgi:hypothetical protein